MELWREELYHHGILGQKWGVRRYQNPDGSLTTSGKKRQVAAENVKNNAEERKILKAQKKFDKNVKKNFYEAYNKAANTMNYKHIDEINKKYEKVDLTKDKEAAKRYAKEFASVWRKEYGDALIKTFGERPEIKSSISNGKDWVNNMPLMNMYDDV